MKSLRVLVVLVTLTCALGAAWPHALAGRVSNSPRESKSKLAIKTASDRTNNDFVTYRVETYDGWQNVKDFSKFQWYFDLKGNGNYTEMCIILEGVGDGRLRAELYPKCGQTTWSTSEARKLAPNVVEFDIKMRDLILGAGLVPGQPFRYRVYAEDFQGLTDWAPARKDAFVEEAGLPRLSDAQLYGEVVASKGHPSGSEFAPGPAAGANSTGRKASRFSPFGGLPLGSVLVLTLIILAVGYFAWRLIAKRFVSAHGGRSTSHGPERPSAQATDGGQSSVHTGDT